MRIAYLVHWTGGEASGVTRKIAGQVMAWRSAGAAASVFAYGRAGVGEFADILARQGIPVNAESFGSVRQRFGAISRSTARCVEFTPDLLYWRHDLWHPAIERLARRVPMVIEVNSDDAAEVRLGHARRRLFHLATRDRLFRRAAGTVFVSGELSRSASFAACRGPRLVLGNGIALAETEPSPPPVSQAPGLVFVASEDQPWHGLDKLVWLASRRPGWNFTVIGAVTVQADAVAHRNLRCLGPLPPPMLRETLALADAGIGTLALHRTGIGEISPLKTREYLAAGLPVILGYRDTDFANGAPFVLELSNREDNVERGLPAMDAFVAEWKGRRVPRDSIRHIDAGAKEAERLAFFRRLAERS